MTRLYSREELLSLYGTILNNETEKERAIDAILPAPLAGSFVIQGVISKEQASEWSSLDRREQRRALIDFICEKNTVEDYIKFTQCVHYIDEVKARKIFPFIPDLIAVGLHDNIRRKGSVKLSPRQPAAQSKVVLLWIVDSEDLFQSLSSVLHGADYQCNSPRLCEIQCRRSSPEEKFEVFVVCCHSKPEAPGRKFDDLLAEFHPCPNLVVYSGSCRPMGGASVKGANAGDYVIVSSSSNMHFDLSAEMLHVLRLCALKKWKEGEVAFMNRTIHVGQATRYAYESEAIVHCPDAITLHHVAATCHIPTAAIVRVGVEAVSEDFVLAIMQELTNNL